MVYAQLSATLTKSNATTVYGVYILDTAATLMNISDTFKWVAEGFGDIMGLDRVLLSPVYTPIFGSIIAGTVQSFYAWRIFKIERKAWPVSVFVLLVSTLEMNC